MQPLGRRDFYKFLLLGLAGPGLGLLAACGPKEYFLSQAQLLERLEKHFPLEKNLLGMAQMRAHNPGVRLNAPAQRLGADLVLSLQHKAWDGSPRSLDAQLGMSCALRFDAQRMALLLHDVALERLDFVPNNKAVYADAAQAWATYAPMVRGLVTQWLAPALEDYPIYKLPTNAQQWLGQNGELEIKILADGLLLKRL